MQLACVMGAGPGEADRHLEKCLRSAVGWADMVVVYGDAPDSATERLIRRYATAFRIGRENLYEQAEHLMRNELFALTDDVLEPGAIAVSLDADEELAGGPSEIRHALQHLPPGRPSWCAQFKHLWAEDGSLHRVDGLWQPSCGPRIYSWRPGIRLEPVYESAWVCPGLPPDLLVPGPPVLTILHWGYALPEDRPVKHERYSRLIGHHPAHIQSILEEPTLEAV